MEFVSLVYFVFFDESECLNFDFDFIKLFLNVLVVFNLMFEMV